MVGGQSSCRVLLFATVISLYDNVHVISKTVYYKYHEVVLFFSFSERHE